MTSILFREDHARPIPSRTFPPHGEIEGYPLLLEAVALDVLHEQLFELLDILLLLGLQAAPELLQFRLAVRIGNVLIVTPQAIKPAAQLVNQIVIVVCTATAFTHMLVFFFRSQGHGIIPFESETFQRACADPATISTSAKGNKKTAVAKRPTVFSHGGLLFNEPPDRFRLPLM